MGRRSITFLLFVLNLSNSLPFSPPSPSLPYCVATFHSSFSCFPAALYSMQCKVGREGRGGGEAFPRRRQSSTHGSIISRGDDSRANIASHTPVKHVRYYSLNKAIWLIKPFYVNKGGRGGVRVLSSPPPKKKYGKTT